MSRLETRGVRGRVRWGSAREVRMISNLSLGPLAILVSSSVFALRCDDGPLRIEFMHCRGPGSPDAGVRCGYMQALDEMRTLRGSNRPSAPGMCPLELWTIAYMRQVNTISLLTSLSLLMHDRRLQVSAQCSCIYSIHERSPSQPVHSGETSVPSFI